MVFFRLIAVAALVAAAALAGCKSNCQQLSEKLCECTLNTADKATCLTRVSNAAGVTPVTPQADKVCAGLLKGCDCHTISTPAGKEACGLARSLDGGLLQ